jgi:hypothetical protein
MTDKLEAETTEKRGPGRPRKRNTDRQPMRKVKPPPVRRYDDGDPDRMERYEFIPFESHDKFAIDRDLVRSFEIDYGRRLMWVALECMGKPLDDFVAARRRNGWEEMPSKQNGGPGIFDYPGVRDGVIKVENHVLMHQPIEINEKARAYERRQAEAAIINMRRSHADEGLSNISMPEGNNAAARAKNVHRRSYEPVKIPE